MSLEPFTGVLISMTRSVKTVIDQGLYAGVARTEPGSKRLEVYGCIVAELKSPHSVRNVTFAFVESLDTTTKHTVEIKTDLSSRDSVHMRVVISADVSNEYQQVIEDLPQPHSDVIISVKELVVAH